MEASLVYPVIIAVTIILMGVTMFFYNMTAQLSDMNRCVRRTAGEQSGTVFYGEDIRESAASFTMTELRGLLSDSITAEGNGWFRADKVFSVSESVSYGARAGVVCEMETVRLKQGIGNVIGNVTG